MKKVILALLAVAFVGSLGFAEEAAVPAAPVAKEAAVPAAPVVKVKTFVGKIVSVSSGDSMAGMMRQITATDSSGKQTLFTVANDATILDKNGEVTSMSWIGKDTRVELKYTETPDGPKLVRSLKVLKGW